MAEDMGRIINNTQIKKVRASDFAACRLTPVNHYTEILQMITPGVRL